MAKTFLASELTIVTMKQNTCKSCYKAPLTKDETGLCIKLLGDDDDGYLCIDCLAAYLDCTIEDLQEKVEEFKDEGCELFQ